MLGVKIELPVGKLLVQNIVLLFVPLIAGSLFKHFCPGAAVKVSKVLDKLAFPALMILAAVFFLQYKNEIADEDKPMKVLDVACGTADFTIEIAQKVSPGSEVTGVDISEGMMAIGREKISKAGVSAELSVADCEALPYPDGTFDRISVGFGVRNFEHLEVGLSEMFRVLVPSRV